MCALSSVPSCCSGSTTSVGVPLAPLKGAEPAHSLDMSGLRLGPLSAGLICKLINTFRPDLTALRLDSNPLLEEGKAGHAAII